MNPRTRSTILLGLLALVFASLGFFAGRMSVSPTPTPVRGEVPSPVPQPIQVAIEPDPPAPEPEPSEVSPEVDEPAALASVKDPAPVEELKPRVVRAARAEAANPPALPSVTSPSPLMGHSSSSGTIPEKPNPEEVLKAKGLRKSGLVYVLEAEETIRTRDLEELGQAQGEWERLASRIDQLVNLAAQQQKLLQGWEYERRQGYQAMAALQAKQFEQQSARSTTVPETTEKGTQTTSTPPVARPTPNEVATYRNQFLYLQQRILHLEAQASEVQFQLIQAQREYDQVGSLALAKEAEIQRRQAAIVTAAESIQKRYDELAKDRKVIAALEELNRRGDLKFALGPVENYRSNLSRMLSELLKSKDLHASSKGRKLVVGLDQDINSLAYQTTTFEDRLGNALSKQKDQLREEESRPRRLEELTARIADLEGQVAATAQSTRKAELSAQLAGAKTELANVQKDEVEAAEVRKKLNENVATNRDGFVQNVIALRKAVELSQEKHDQLEMDPTVKKAKNRLKTTVAPLPKGALDVLKKAEKVIQSAEIPLEADKTTVQVDAMVNDQNQKLVVDPAIEVVRVSAAFASEIGIELSATSPEFDLTMEDGRSLPAKRSTIRTLAVGPFSIANLECVVVLKDYDAPPALGANFLNQFSYKLDSSAGTLTLTQVNILPKSKTAERPRSSR